MSAIEVSEDSNLELSKPAGGESCFLESSEKGREGACYVTEALKGVLKPPTYEVACKIVSNNGVFTRQDIIHDLAYGGNPAALYKRFQVAISFIRSSKVLSPLLEVSGRTSTREYRLDASALPAVCSKIREGASVRDQVSEADRNNTSDPLRTDIFNRSRNQNQKVLGILTESNEQLELSWGSESAGLVFRRIDSAYGGLSRKACDTTTDKNDELKAKNIWITPSKQRQHIVKHKNEIEAGLNEVSTLSPDGVAIWNDVASYLSGGKDLPAVYEAPLADLILIYDVLRHKELAIAEDSGYVSARIKHVRMIIKDLLNVWEIEFKNLDRDGGRALKPWQANSWKESANCLGVDPSLFYPDRGASIKEAKETCRSCVVKEECLDFAISSGEKFGVWGGLSERERRKVRKSRKQQT